MKTALALMLTLVWNRSPEPDVAGYWLYQGAQSGHYTNVVDIGNVGTATVVGMVTGATNFFAVRSYSQARGGSEASREYQWPEPWQAPTVEARQEPRPTGVGIRLSWASEPGAVYRVVSAVDLGMRWFGWTDLTGDLAAAGTLMEWADPVTGTERFYRVVRVR